MLNSAKCVGFPRQLRQPDSKYGLPPLPRLDVCLRAGGDLGSPALKQLRRIVTESDCVLILSRCYERTSRKRIFCANTGSISWANDNNPDSSISSSLERRPRFAL